MKNGNMKIEQRLQNMKDFYAKAESLLEHLPDAIPEKTKEVMKDVVLGDKELKALMEGIDTHRPPRLFLIGRTGVGKSSLINALCGKYLASVSDTHSCTENAQIYQYKEGDRVLMEICDTRGVSESESINEELSAEEQLIRQINEFSPDAAIFLLNCTHRDDVDEDIEFLKKLTKAYAEVNKMRLPVVVALNKSDEMAPSRFKKPEEYPKSKVDKIEEMVQQYKGLIVRKGLKIDDIIAISSLIDWRLESGQDIDADSIDNLPQHDIENLEIAFDGRYHINELLDILEESIQDFEAKIGLRMAARLTEVVHRVANHLISVFSTISMGVAVTPIPVSDIYILIFLQAVLVSLIAALSGRDVSIDSAKEFIMSMGGVSGAGFVFRFVAQQASKLANIFFPGSGSAISSGIAFAGTKAIGEAAVRYYIDGATMKDAKGVFEKLKAVKENKLTVEK